MKQALEFRVLCPELEGATARFFERIRANGLDKHFHPHPFTVNEAARLTRYEGKDLYYVLWDGEEVIGYGLLRGWDEGYEVPSLGIAMDVAAQGQGYGRLMMQFLHAAAAIRGAKRIRLKVYAENVAAIALYRSLGYTFHGEEAGQLVGSLDL